jgi:iron complex transport system ATP-binding protein
MKLEITGLNSHYGRRTVLDGVTVPGIAPGSVTALLGPNAAGKSTLLRSILGLQASKGSMTLDGADLRKLSRRERSRHIGYLPQDVGARCALTAIEVVLLALKQGSGWTVDEQDLAAAHSVMDDLGIRALSERPLHELSGGQRQLVAVAQSLVRRPKILLLDEPTSALDLHHQLDLLGLVQRLARRDGLTALIALHDLNLAARFADRIIVLHGGRIAADGTPAEVLTPQVIADVWRVQARIEQDHDGTPMVIPEGALAAA